MFVRTIKFLPSFDAWIECIEIGGKQMQILMIDDEAAIRSSIGDFLKRLGYRVTTCESAVKAIDLMKETHFDLILSDILMPVMDGMEFLRIVKERNPDVIVVMITGHGTVRNAVEAMKEGAYDYLLKPLDMLEIKALLDRVEEYLHLRENNRRLNRILREYSDIGDEFVFFCDTMRQVYDFTRTLHNKPDIPILLAGETGTGKEVIAREIHRGEKGAPFIAINCAAISHELFESELFGYEAGSFTGGARDGKIGKIELAENGTLFLDEIGEMSQEYQAKLLRLLQEREFFRVGGTRKIRTNARIICATNCEIEHCLQSGRIRADLYHRLSVGYIRIPPLRERTLEIVPFAKYFLEKLLNGKRTTFHTISDAAARVLKSYSWPGNVRELKHVLERISLLYQDGTVEPGHIDPLLNRDYVKPGKMLEEEILERSGAEFNLHQWIGKVVMTALERHDGNKTKTAQYLGITRSELYTYLKNVDE